MQPPLSRACSRGVRSRPRRMDVPWPFARAMALALALAALLLPLSTARAVLDERGGWPADAPPTASAPPPGGPLPPDARYFGQTGHYLRGAFLAYWLEQGGADRFGYPLSEQYEAAGADGVRRPMQLFERARFELHARPDGGAAVELGQLGREALDPVVFARTAPFAPTAEREYFDATGHSLGFGFRDFWHANDGLRLLGYPLSEELPEGTLTVQYFERGRLEFDPAAPPERAVRMAPLGTHLLVRKGWPLPARIALTLHGVEPTQGATAVAELFSDRALTIIGARLDDQPVAFFGGRFQYRALVGVPPSMAAGDHTLAVEVREASGAVKTVEETVRVRDANFPRERITLPPDQDDLLDPAVLARELRIVEPLYRIVTPERRWTGRFTVPAQGPITTEFGTMRAYNDGPFASWHNGLDIGAPQGAPVVAPAPGRVVFAGKLDIRGNFVAIDHGLGVLTLYFHQDSLAVSAGQEVNTGDLIGYVGTTGLSTGPHLHWEVRVAGVPVNPWQWLQGDVLP